MPEYHVFVRPGDAAAEVEALLKELRLSPDAAGLHKLLFVTQARQTVVMLTSPAAPLAAALRGRPGWTEPGAAS